MLMKRQLLFLISSVLVIPCSVCAHEKVTAELSAGLTFSHNIVDASIGGPGFSVGGGLGYALGDPLILYWNAAYSYFPYSKKEPPVYAQLAAEAPSWDNWISVGEAHHSVDASIGVRLIPRGREASSYPYFVFGAGISWLSEGGFPGTSSVVHERPGDFFIAAGFGYEGALSQRARIMIEFAPMTVFNREGAYLPLRMGVRF